MPPFFCLRETDAIAAFIAEARPLPAESISVAQALGRVLAADMRAPRPCPPQQRSTRDGFAVRAADVATASAAAPARLRLAGECRMGQEAAGALTPGEAWRVYTGGALPLGADAVLMQERALVVEPPLEGQRQNSGEHAGAHIAALAPCCSGENILAAGADMPEGSLLAQCGSVLGAHQVALLAQFFSHLPVRRRPVLGVLSTGDEFCAAASSPFDRPENNALLLECLATALGARCVRLGTAPDNEESQRRRLVAALADGPDACDALVVIGGSSGGKKDFGARAIASLPGCRLYGQDQKVSSGRPLTLARVGQTTVWGLPGHALSLALAAQVFLAPLLRRLAGLFSDLSAQPGPAFLAARLGVALPARGPARTHYPVMLRQVAGLATAWPVAAGTGKTVVLRDMKGWITVPGEGPETPGGLRRGAAVRVWLFR